VCNLTNHGQSEKLQERAPVQGQARLSDFTTTNMAFFSTTWLFIEIFICNTAVICYTCGMNK